MAYIGREPQIGNYQVCDAISVVNGQAAYTMQVSSADVTPESVNHMIVSLNGVIQNPGSSYTISGSTITFSSNLATGDSIDFIYLLGNTLDLGTPSDATVTTAKLSGNLVTPGTLDVNGQELILDADADTSITADTDDQIDIKVAGADDFRITANTFTALSGSGVVIPDGGLTLGSTAVSSTAAELNILDGVTSTAAELNILDGVTSTAAELNILDGVTSTAAELNLLDGGTSVGSSITVADADGVVVNDGGTMKTIPASDIKTYAGVTPIAFQMNRGDNTQQTISNNTGTVVEFSGEEFDIGSGADPSNNKWVCPSGEGGKYFFYFRIGYSNPSTSGHRILYLQRANSGASFSAIKEFQDNGALFAGNAATGWNGSAVLDVDETQEVRLEIYQGSGGNLSLNPVSGQNLFFGGFKIAGTT